MTRTAIVSVLWLLSACDYDGTNPWLRPSAGGSDGSIEGPDGAWGGSMGGGGVQGVDGGSGGGGGGAPTYGLSGTVSGAIAQGVVVNLNGAVDAQTTTDALGGYQFSGLSSGHYTVTPSLSGYEFEPALRSVDVSGADVAGLDFNDAEVPPPVSFGLSVARGGTKTGSVTSTPAGINCGVTCRASFDGGTLVSLKATSYKGSTFAGWFGGGCSLADTCTLTMDGAKRVTATFVVDGGWLSFAAGEYHSLGVTSDGRLWAWGDNTYGELGTGDTVKHNAPVQIGSDSDWLLVRGGEYRSFAIKSNGTLWAWGKNTDGTSSVYSILGTQDTVDRHVPVQIGSATSWGSASTYYCSSLGIHLDGTLWGWGWNGSGVLGTGDGAPKGTPVQIGRDTDWSMAAATFNHTIAIRVDGSLWAWGNNTYGQLGQGFFPSQYESSDVIFPTRVGVDDQWVWVSGATWHSVAVKSDGTLWAWGWNGSGNLGTGDRDDRNTPTQVGQDADWISTATACQHSFAVKRGGTVWGWGESVYGTTNQYTTSPIQIGPDAGWVSVSDGCAHQLAQKADGTLWGIGNNGAGQLGVGDNLSRQTHVRVFLP